MHLYESSQDYLERILILNKKMKVRSIDIANDMNITKQSVHRAIKNLKENNYILVDSKGFITLTESGYEVANAMYERHTILTEFFVSLGVEREIALKDACKVEHDLSIETFEAIKKAMNKNSN